MAKVSKMPIPSLLVTLGTLAGQTRPPRTHAGSFLLGLVEIGRGSAWIVDSQVEPTQRLAGWRGRDLTSQPASWSRFAKAVCRWVTWSLRTAMAMAFFVPTSTTSSLARVIAV